MSEGGSGEGGSERSKLHGKYGDQEHGQLGNIADERVQIDHILKDSVDRLVRAERDSVLSKNLGGIKVAGKRNDEIQKLRKICEERWFDVALTRHNLGEAHMHANTMLITSMQWHPDNHYGSN